jgi:hypothetical protein
LTQGGQRRGLRCAFHLNKVGLGRLSLRVGDPGLQAAIVHQHHQPLAIAVKPAGGIDPGNIDIIGKRRAALRIRELRKHAERLVEQNDPRHDPS